MIVSQSERTCTCEAVKVFVAFDIGDPDTIGFGDSKGEFTRVATHIRLHLTLTGQIVLIGGISDRHGGLIHIGFLSQIGSYQ